MHSDAKLAGSFLSSSDTRSRRLPPPLRQTLRLVSFGAILVGILFFLVLPTMIIVPMSVSTTEHLQFPPSGLSLRWYAEYFQNDDWMASTWFSLRIAVATSLAATVIGTMTALAINRGELPLKGAILAIALGPMIVPHIVLGVALYLVFTPLQMTGTFLGFLIGHTVLAVPFVVITVTASLERIDSSLELAALSCGANRWQAFSKITLPNIAPGLASGAVFAFLASFDEATVAFFISDTGGKSIGRKMFEDIDFGLTPVIAAASTVIVIGSFCLIGLAHFTVNGCPSDSKRGDEIQ